MSEPYGHGSGSAGSAGGAQWEGGQRQCQQWGVSNGSGQNVDRATVTNVGDVDGLHTQNEKHVGILVQNMDNDPFGGPVDRHCCQSACARRSSVTRSQASRITGAALVLTALAILPPALESGEAFFCHMPGIKVVVPSGPYNAKGLLRAAIRDPDPVIFLEPTRLYRLIREEVPDEEYTVPLGKARLAWSTSHPKAAIEMANLLKQM